MFRIEMRNREIFLNKEDRSNQMATQAEQILKEKEIQGIIFSLYGKIFVSFLVLIVTFFVAQTLYEVLMISLVNLSLMFVMAIMIRLIKKNKAVFYIGLFCISIDLIIVVIRTCF